MREVTAQEFKEWAHDPVTLAMLDQLRGLQKLAVEQTMHIATSENPPHYTIGLRAGLALGVDEAIKAIVRKGQ